MYQQCWSEKKKKNTLSGDMKRHVYVSATFMLVSGKIYEQIFFNSLSLSLSWRLEEKMQWLRVQFIIISNNTAHHVDHCRSHYGLCWRFSFYTSYCKCATLLFCHCLFFISSSFFALGKLHFMISWPSLENFTHIFTSTFFFNQNIYLINIRDWHEKFFVTWRASKQTGVYPVQ